MKKLLILLFLLISLVPLRAQVGINNTKPDSSSILDVAADNRGLLIPRLNSGQRDGISSPAESLLVYDTDKKGFYFYTSGAWYALNEWVKSANSSNVSLTGNATVSGTLSTGSIANSGGINTNSITANNVYSWGISNSGAISTNSLTSSGGVSAGSFSTTGSVSGSSLTISGFTTNALVPRGAILMWSGSIASIPSGWVLCNGLNNTPDLRGRFIVGYSNTDSDYSTVGNSGGEKRHILSIAEMPTHSHPITTGGDNKMDDVSGGYIQGRNNPDGRVETNHSTGLTGSGFAHENRPPYYTLAYIMKL